MVDGNRTDHLLEDQLVAVHSQAGDTALNPSGDHPVELILDHGWQAGTGNVLATRTLSGDLPAAFPTADGSPPPTEHFVETVTIATG